MEAALGTNSTCALRPAVTEGTPKGAGRSRISDRTRARTASDSHRRERALPTPFRAPFRPLDFRITTPIAAAGGANRASVGIGRRPRASWLTDQERQLEARAVMRAGPATHRPQGEGESGTPKASPAQTASFRGGSLLRCVSGGS